MDRWVQRVGGVLLVGAVVFAGGTATAAGPLFTSGSTGNDGAFSPPSSVPPGTTVNGSIYTVPLPPSGIFNFSTITVPANTTVTFMKNAANTPVILLATEAVTINGTLNVSGSDGGALGRPGPGGPGGFDGGPGADGVTAIFAGGGLGPGGGNPGTGNNCGGSFATQGVVGTNCAPAPAPAPTYGSPALRPILGGSGGAGGGVCCLPGNPAGNGSGGAGGGGGGALIVASSGTITVTGQILADGGTGVNGNGLNVQGGGGGSGGAIRLIATSITSSGSLYARGKIGGYAGGTGGFGRIRLEAYTLTVPAGTRSPEATQGLPQAVFPAAGQPTLTITSVAGVAAPASPSGSFLTTPDILLPSGTTSQVQVVLTATNVPLGTTIAVTATPQSGAKSPPATSTGLAGTFANSSATANLEVSLTQTSVLTATATFPMVAFSAGPGPVYAAGEEITHVRVAAVVGGPSTVTYLTKSGREVVVR